MLHTYQEAKVSDYCRCHAEKVCHVYYTCLSVANDVNGRFAN